LNHTYHHQFHALQEVAHNLNLQSEIFDCNKIVPVTLSFNMPAGPVRHSGLQNDILKLMRDLYRAARKKDPENSKVFTAFGKTYAILYKIVDLYLYDTLCFFMSLSSLVLISIAHYW
jgi:hypothetical protein